MYGNESLVNAHFIIGSKIYMKSGNNRNKCDTGIKLLKIVDFIDLWK